MIKKIIAFLMAFTMCVGFFSCGESSNDKSDDEATTVEKITETKVELPTGESSNDKSDNEAITAEKITETKVELPTQISEMVGTYSVESVNVVNRGEDLGISESDLSVCKTVEITEDGKIICNGLFNDSEFELSYDLTTNTCYNLHSAESEKVGFTYIENYSAQDYNLEKDFEGVTLIEYFYKESTFFEKGEMSVYVKFNCGTDAWYGSLMCLKTD